MMKDCLSHMARAVALTAMACLMAFAAACSRAPGPLVLAPSSMQGALDEVADAWEQRGEARPVLSFAGTPALARQVEAGAAADLFVSADETWMNEVARKGLIEPRTRFVLASNRLVLVAPSDSTVELDVEPGFAIRSALGNVRLAMADPDAVPAGRYARQALTTLGVWQDVSEHITRTENVRVALALVARGEAPLGIVYASDALSEPGVRTVATFPDSNHMPIAYPVARLKASTHGDTVAFTAFLQSPEVRDILVRHGFRPSEAR